MVCVERHNQLTAQLTANINHIVFSIELFKAAKSPTKIMAMSARMRTVVVIKGKPESKARSIKRKHQVSGVNLRSNSHSA